MTRLIIKGNKFQAARAAADRGFPFVFKHENDHDTVGLTPIIDIDRLNKWICEDGNPPYLPGSLLLWTPLSF